MDMTDVKFTSMVTEFHKKNGFPVRQQLNDFLHENPRADQWLMGAGALLVSLSEQVQTGKPLNNQSMRFDSRLLRAHLMIEELGEFLIALGACDELDAFDASCDLSYVVAGTAVTYGWPLEAGFAEVHRSNMSKEKQPSDPLAVRLRDKGPNYSPPDLVSVLNAGRYVIPTGENDAQRAEQAEQPDVSMGAGAGGLPLSRESA